MIAAHHSAIQSSVLALNRHFVAVHILPVPRAFCLLYKGAAEVISVEGGIFQSYNFEDWLETGFLRREFGEVPVEGEWIRTVNFEIQIPRIIRLMRYDRLPRNAVKFNRRNIFLRDENCCQYCGRRLGTQKLSLDHVQPKSRGGPTTWENIVCCCLDCNVRKGGRTPVEAGMKLMKVPLKPVHNPLLFHHMGSRKYESWQAFLSD